MKDKAGIHPISRLWGLLWVFVALLCLVFGYNYAYNHASPQTRRTWDAQREWFVDHIPDYHPKKSTKGTRKAQVNEQKIKQKIRNRGN